jgi:hypothetical protein
MIFRAPLALALLIAGCGGPEPPMVPVPQESGVHYRVFIKTFQDGAYADQPFDLLVQADANAEPRTVLRAGQCKNVSVGQTAGVLYVFYDELTLNVFSSQSARADEPQIALCDVQVHECSDARKRLAGRGIKLSNVCTFRTDR